MKRLTSTLGALLFLAAALPALAFDDGVDRNDRDRGRDTHAAATRRPLIIDEVIRMSQAGVGDDTIISYVRKYRDGFDVNADDVIALTDAKVSQTVIKEVVAESESRSRDDRQDRDRRPARRVSTAVYVDPWFYPYYYDPFWYGPRLSIGIRLGGGRFFRGGFHHRHP